MPIRFARLLLTFGLAYVFLFFGIDKFVHPLLWIGWMPPWLQGMFGLMREQWLPVAGVAEVAIGLLILVPHAFVGRLGTALAALYLLFVLTQTGFLNETGVRDTGLLFAAAALFVLRLDITNGPSPYLLPLRRERVSKGSDAGHGSTSTL